MAYKPDICVCVLMLCTQVNMMFLMIVLSVHPHRESWKVCLTTVGIEPATFEILVQCSVNWGTKSVRVCDISELSLYFLRYTNVFLWSWYFCVCVRCYVLRWIWCFWCYSECVSMHTGVPVDLDPVDLDSRSISTSRFGPPGPNRSTSGYGPPEVQIY